MPQDMSIKLQSIAESCRVSFDETHRAREHALQLSREIVRNSANSIRATHRGEFNLAKGLLKEVSLLAQEVKESLTNHPAVYYAGYVEDAVKEFAEASVILACAERTTLPGPDDLGIGPAPYLNGVAEAIGEMRRSILDSLRRDDLSRSEEMLEVMDEAYSVLVTMDFPDAVTRGLRRTTDMARGVLERTRGDLTLALRQHRFEQKLAAYHEVLEGD